MLQTVNRIAFKPDVRLVDACLDPCMMEALRVAVRTAPELGEDTLVVTSAQDSQHGAASLHYVGRAWDIRFTGQRIGGIVGLPAQQLPEAEAWAKRMRQQLPEGYDVIVEGDHIHVERDSKRGG